MQERLLLVEELGCPECAQAFKEGQEVQEACMRGAYGETQCQAANPGSKFVSDGLPTNMKTSGCGVRLVRAASSASSPQSSTFFTGMIALAAVSITLSL